MNINTLTDWEIAIQCCDDIDTLKQLKDNYKEEHEKARKKYELLIKKFQKDINPVVINRYLNLIENDMDNGHNQETYDEIDKLVKKRIKELEKNQAKSKKVVLQISENYQIIAEAYEDGIFADMNVYLTNNKGEMIQELVSVRHPYDIIHNENEDFVEKIKDKIQVLVWADCDNEDFTDDYNINIYTEDVEPEI